MVQENGKPLKFSKSYLRTLAAMPNAGMANAEGTLPLKNAARHLLSMSARTEGSARQAILELAESLRFAQQIKKGTMPVALSGLATYFLPLPVAPVINYLRARAIRQHIEGKERTLIPCSTSDHEMLMEFVREKRPDGRPTQPPTYSVRIYNAGDGLQHHATRAGTGKVETLYEHTGVELGPGRGRINANEIRKLLDNSTALNRLFLSRAEAVYRWLEPKGRPHNDLPERIAQREQKSGDCPTECIMAYLRNNLPDETYKRIKADLLEQAAGAAGSGRHLAEVKARLEAKALSARRGASRAARYEDEDVSSRHASWYAGRQNPETFAGQLLASSRARGEPLFAITRNPDARGDYQVAFTPAWSGAPRRSAMLPIEYDAGAAQFVLEGRRFDDLSAIASHVEGAGYRALQPSSTTPAHHPAS